MEEITKPKVSLLLLTLDRYQMTKYCLNNLLAKTGFPDFELLVMDNGSTDKRTVNLTSEESFPLVKKGSLIQNETNIGIAAGFNQLLRKAQGEYICFLSNDIFVYENWLSELIHYNNEIDKAGMTTIFCDGDKGTFSPLLNSRDEFTHVWKPTKNITRGISLINRMALEDVGAFDEKLGIYGREREQYALRLANLNYNNFYIPNNFSVHLGREVNDNSQYRAMKDKALQQSIGYYTESLKNKTNKIAL